MYALVPEFTVENDVIRKTISCKECCCLWVSIGANRVIRPRRSRIFQCLNIHLIFKHVYLNILAEHARNKTFFALSSLKAITNTKISENGSVQYFENAV